MLFLREGEALMHPVNKKVFDFFEIELPNFLLKIGKNPEVRYQQITMSQYVAHSAYTKTPAIIEAKVGTGKTLAYLVPMYHLARTQRWADCTLRLRSSTLPQGLLAGGLL